MLKHWGIMMAALAGAVWVTAASTPVEFGIFSPVQFPGSETTPVKGFRLNLCYTYNPAVYGIDLGVINNAKTVGGFAAGAMNAVHAMYGVQAGVYNRIGYSQDLEPVESSGVQLGWTNDVQTAFTGLQAGVANLGGTVAGVQIGLANSVESASESGWTLQIGFLNFNDDGYWPIMPLIGWSSGIQIIETVEVTESVVVDADGAVIEDEETVEVSAEVE